MQTVRYRNFQFAFAVRATKGYSCFTHAKRLNYIITITSIYYFTPTLPDLSDSLRSGPQSLYEFSTHYYAEGKSRNHGIPTLLNNWICGTVTRPAPKFKVTTTAMSALLSTISAENKARKDSFPLRHFS